VLRLDRHVPIESGVDAVILTASNLTEAANLCGGALGSRQIDYNQDETVLKIPTLDGVKKAGPGEYLVKYENGRWDTLTKAAFEEKYKKVGQRQDGFQPRTRGGTFIKGDSFPPLMNNTRTGGSVEPKGWGLNSDSP